jgi:hypothetical protein
MKKFSILFLAFVALLSFNACTQDDDIVFVAQPDPEGIQFSNSFQSSYMLPSGNPDNLAERFVWNEVDFEAPTTITYELQGSANESFGDFMVIGTTGSNNLGVTIGQMRALAEDAGLDNDPETEMPNTGTVYFKVRAFAGEGAGNALEEFSETLSINLELPEAEEEGEETKTELYLVGDATEAGWDPDNNNTPMLRDPENDNMYSFSGYFNAGAVKFVEGTGWAPQYGIDENNNLVYRATEDDPDPSAIAIETAGYYTIEVNLDDLTYSVTEIDASSAETYDSIGIVGDGTSVGWPNDDNPSPDIEMTQSEFDTHIWYAENVVLTDGPFKFRANFAWDVNWGGASFPTGETTGDDIQATAGTYDVWFNTLDESYILIPQVEE